MDDRTMYMCMEIIALINLLQGKIVPPKKKNKKKKKKKKNNDTPAPSGHHKCSDTLYFLKRHLFNVSYISGHAPYRVFLLSVNVRTPIT